MYQQALLKICNYFFLPPFFIHFGVAKNGKKWSGLLIWLFFLHSFWWQRADKVAID